MSARRRVGIIAAVFTLVGSLLLAPAGQLSSAAARVDDVSATRLDQASSVAAGPRVNMADLSQFQPGNIISDAKFFDSGTMSEAQIQSFLESKVARCASGYTCLKDYYDTARTISADAMCGAYLGGSRERASRIIYKVAQACGINPQVILVMLQKEQGLVTTTAPSSWNYQAAMGQGCPDTAACDSRYYGLFNQVFWGAWQMKRYANPPGTSQYFTWYAPGRTWNIQWHPNAGCGSSPVYIQNQATANLYYYTPYQPNAAALRAGYGTGDSCSSYGNRNFYQYFTDWFGSPQGELLQVLQVSGTSERYIVSQGGRWRLTTAEIAAQFTWISVVRNVSRTELDAYQDRGPAERAIRTESGIVYLLDSGQRLRLRDINQVVDFGWDYASLPVATDGQAARYRDGGWLERVVRSDGANWLVQGGTRRQVVDLALLPRYGILAVATDVSAPVVGEYAVSSPVVSVGVYRDATNQYRVLTDAGVFTVPRSVSGTAIAGSARDLTEESFAFLKPSADLPVRITSGGRNYVLLEDGWLEVSASEYPAGLPFTSVPNGTTTGVAGSGRATSPHFVRERSDSQVYLVSWGTMQAVSGSEQTWITQRFGVNPRVWVALDGVIGDVATTEGLVRTSSGALYLLDGARAYRFRDCGQVGAWGADCASLPTITDAKLGAYANGGILRDLVRTPAGTIWLPQGGHFRQVLDPGILAVYGIPSTTTSISTATASKFPVGEPVLAAGVYSDGSQSRVAVTEGGEYRMNAQQSVGLMNTVTRALTPASFSKITVDGPLPSRMRADNRAFVLTREGWLEVPTHSYGGDGVFTPLASRAWTGIAIAANEPRPHYIRDNESGQEYLVSYGTIQPVSGATERAQISSRYGVPPRVWPVVADALSGLRINFDLVVKDGAGNAYLIDGDSRYRMSSCAAAAEFGKDCSTLRVISASQLAGLRDGGALQPLLRSPDGYNWLVQSGARREVPDPRVLAAYGIGANFTVVSNELIAQLRLGEPVVGVGVYSDRAGDVRVITGNGRTFSVPEGSRVGAVIGNAWAISPASIDLLVAEGDLPTRVDTGTQTFILTTEGWLAVSASSYTPLPFAALGVRGTEGIPAAGAQTGPHFVRENGQSQVYLASGGLGAVADEATKAWITATYGVPPKVWVVAAGALR